MDNIYEDLRSGRTAEEIVAAFTAQLNAAEARIKQEEEEKAKAAHKTMKRDALKALIDDSLRYLAVYYPAFGIEIGDWNDEELNLLADLCTMALDLEAMKGTTLTKSADKKPGVLDVKIEHNNKDAKTVVAPNPESKIDEVFNDFFKTMGL